MAISLNSQFAIHKVCFSPEEGGEPGAEVAGQDVVADVYVLGESATRNVFTN